MARRAKRSVLTLKKKRERDQIKTALATMPGGRYYRPSVSEQIRLIRPTSTSLFNK